MTNNSLLKFIGKFVKAIITIIIVVGLVIGVIVGFSSLQLYLVKDNNYILWGSSEFTFMFFMISFVIMLIFMLLLITNNNLFDKDSDIVILLLWLSNKSKLGLKRFGLVLLIIYILIFSYSIFDFSSIYENKIVKYTILNPQGKDYTWNDVSRLEIGITSSFRLVKKNDLYFSIILNNNMKLTFTGVSDSKDNHEDAMLIVKNIAKENGVKIDIDRSNLNKWGNDLDKDYVDKILLLFE